MFEKLFYFNNISTMALQKIHEFTFLKSQIDWKNYISKLTSLYTEESYSSTGVPVDFPCFVITFYQRDEKIGLHKFDHYFLGLDQIIEVLSGTNLNALLTHENANARAFARKLTEKR